MKHLTFLIVGLLLAVSLRVSAQAVTPADSIPNDGIIRVLAIGNSFSHDGVEQYLWELAHEAGIEMIIGNAYRGGQGFQSHMIDITEQHNTFEYRKIVGGRRTNTPHQALQTIIRDEPWQYITVQQVSQESGLTTTFEPWMTQLVEYAATEKTNPNAQFGFHQTWAYAHDSTHGGFANYGNQQQVMYDSIMNAVQWAMARHPELNFVVPSGTSIQNARTSYLGDNMNRDGYHLDLKMGRYTAACAWLETITGKNPVGLNFRPEGVDALAARICQMAAHAAVASPYAVTSLAGEGFAAQNDITPSSLIKLNFGDLPTEDSSWNNIAPGQRTYTWITDARMNPTGIVLTNSEGFLGTNTSGATYTTTKMLMPAQVSQSCVWSYATGSFGGQSPRQSGVITLSHLNPNLRYDFSIFASRVNSRDFRETSFVLQGDGTYAGELDAANNASEASLVKNVRPSEDGMIRIIVMPGPHNTNVNKFFYLNAITIKSHK